MEIFYFNTMKKIVFIMLLCVFLLGCKRNPEGSGIEIKVANAEMMNEDRLYEFVDKLEFTVIDTTLTYFTYINKIIVDDSLLIILVGKERKEIVIVDKAGHLNGRIDYLGGGPGEYKQITDFSYNFTTNEIILYDIVTKSLFSYDLKGNFNWQKKFDLYATNFITDDQFYYFYTKKLISELGRDHEVVVLDKNFKLINSYFTYSEQPERFRYSAVQVFDRTEKSEILFSNVFRDTTYIVSSKTCAPYCNYSINKELPTGYTLDRDLFNNYFKKFNFFSGLNTSTQNWLYFRVTENSYFMDFYIATVGKHFLKTYNGQLSKNIFLSNPIGHDNQFFYYSISPDLIENHIDELNKLLQKFNRPDLVSYFDKDLLSYNPIIVRIKFVD